MKKLIVNADDFGFTHGINMGVVQAFTQGIVTSSTIMVNMPFADEAFELAKRHKIPVGIHHNITHGENFLTGNDKGLFGTDGKANLIRTGKLESVLTNTDMDLVIREYAAQIEYFYKHMGKMPTHMDHHHNHQAVPGYKERYFAFAQSRNIPIRSRLYREAAEFNLTTANTIISKEFFYEKDLYFNHLKSLLTLLPDGVTELVTHPSMKTGETIDSYTEIPRYMQVQVLTDPRIAKTIEELQIILTTYDEIGK